MNVLKWQPYFNCNYDSSFIEYLCFLLNTFKLESSLPRRYHTMAA